MNRTTQKILLRAAAVFVIQQFIKTFDQGFSGPFEVSWRSLAFTLFTMGYLLFMWYVAEYLDNNLREKLKTKSSRTQLIYSFFFLSVWCIITAIFIAEFYRFWDTTFFQSYDIWNKIKFPDYDLSMVFIMITFFVLIVHSINSHIQKERLLKEQAQQLKIETIQAQYQVLENQIAPHFLFNNLSVLTSLVYKDADMSAQFIQHLSKLYRYLLDKNKERLVPLQTELNFLEDYIFLMKIRFTEGVIFDIDISEKTAVQYYIPPNTLQFLVENAIKHNQVRQKMPLHIRFFESDEYIICQNNIQKRAQDYSSTKVGLENIYKRYMLLVNKSVVVEQTDNLFIVKLPKLKVEDESFNP
jgi:two-component system LytT family sensor kinase